MTVDDLLKIIEGETYLDTSGADGDTAMSSFGLEFIEVLAVVMSAEGYLGRKVLPDGTIDEKLAFLEPVRKTTVQGLLDFILENAGK